MVQQQQLELAYVRFMAAITKAAILLEEYAAIMEGAKYKVTAYTRYRKAKDTKALAVYLKSEGRT